MEGYHICLMRSFWHDLSRIIMCNHKGQGHSDTGCRHAPPDSVSFLVYSVMTCKPLFLIQADWTEGTASWGQGHECRDRISRGPGENPRARETTVKTRETTHRWCWGSENPSQRQVHPHPCNTEIARERGQEGGKETTWVNGVQE